VPGWCRCRGLFWRACGEDAPPRRRHRPVTPVDGQAERVSGRGWRHVRVSSSGALSSRLNYGRLARTKATMPPGWRTGDDRYPVIMHANVDDPGCCIHKLSTLSTKNTSPNAPVPGGRPWSPCAVGGPAPGPAHRPRERTARDSGPTPPAKDQTVLIFSVATAGGPPAESRQFATRCGILGVVGYWAWIYADRHAPPTPDLDAHRPGRVFTCTGPGLGDAEADADPDPDTDTTPVSPLVLRPLLRRSRALLPPPPPPLAPDARSTPTESPRESFRPAFWPDPKGHRNKVGRRRSFHGQAQGGGR
jgi:hypothetical protein